ncbi:hypothetical protein ACFV0C_04025 [Streptomyces sp. NPDC059568]|uniref:hypothetical protein n=1 Tax=Streptomyces sp. NPDC059568 TaxID=3346868 RepID=UPI0036ABDA08
MAAFEAGHGVDEGDEVGCVHGPPPLLGGLAELEALGGAGIVGSNPTAVPVLAGDHRADIEPAVPMLGTLHRVNVCCRTDRLEGALTVSAAR